MKLPVGQISLNIFSNFRIKIRVSERLIFSMFINNNSLILGLAMFVMLF